METKNKAERKGRTSEDQARCRTASERREHKEKLKTTFNGSRKKFFAAGGS
jgi:hypothetical protein